MKSPRQLSQHWLFTTYLLPYRAELLLLLVLVVTALILQLITPVLVGHFIDKAIAKHPASELIHIGLWYVGLTLLAQFVSVLDNYLVQNLAWTATNNIRADLTRHCLRLGPTFFREHSPGVMVERIDGDVAQLSNFLSRFAFSLLSSILLMVGIVAAVARIDWRFGCVLLAFAIIGLASFHPIRKLIVVRARDLRQAQSEWTGFIEETVNGREDIRTCGAVPYIAGRISEIHRRLLRSTRASTSVNTLGWSIGATLFGLAHILVIVGGAWLFFGRHITIGTVYLLFNYTMWFLTPLFGIARQVQDVQQSIGSGDRILELFRMSPEVPDGAGAVLPDGAPEVEFDGVSFGYDADGLVLHDISFTLSAGQKMAIVGPTGSGKSTMARLLFRFLDVSSGRIRVGGCDIREPNLSDLRSRIALVTQDVQLFRGTLRDNIALFDRGVGDETLHAAIGELGLTEWYQSLPNGLDTRFRGHDDLSAGEAQLVALLRVYLKRPGLVILDEASAKLDPVTAGRVQSAIERLLNNRTAIIIAHRLEATRTADIVLALENGRMRDFGARQDLEASLDSYYGGLLSRPPEIST